MQLSEKLKDIFCTYFYDNLFNSRLLINKLFEENIYGIRTVKSSRKHMPKQKMTRKWLEEIRIFSSQKMPFGLTINLSFYQQQILKEWMQRET